MKNLKLTTDKKIILIGAAVLGIMAAIYTAFYAPLLGELGKSFREYRKLESQVVSARNTIETAGKLFGDRTLLTEDQAHQAIDELTKQKTVRGVNFISINPGDVIHDKKSRHKILPVGMQVESTYEELGRFLGALDDQKRGLVKVKSFDITHDPGKPRMFITDITVEIYMSEREI